MSELLDETGKRFVTTDSRCPTCGADKKDRQKITSFGGYFRDVCVKCGYLYDSGRETPEIKA